MIIVQRPVQSNFKQGDQNWANFRLLAIVSDGQILKNTEEARIFGLHFPAKICAINWNKKYWATFWAIPSPTHQVTLV
jgi:hypothetical protein